MTTVLAPLPVIIPLGTAALLAALHEKVPRLLADLATHAALLGTLAVSLRLMVMTRSEPLVYWFGGWTPRSNVALGVSFVIDPIGAGLAAFISLLALASMTFSLKYFDSAEMRFHVLMLGFVGGMCGYCLSGDLFNMFVFFEVMSAAAFALCGHKNEDSSAQQGAFNFALTNTVGAFLVLIGIGLLYSRTGALNLAQIGHALGTQCDAAVIVSFVLIMCGFYVKAAAFPFQFWLADAHAVAPTPVCVLFSGVMVELGVYGVARIYWAAMDAPFAAHREALTFVLLSIGTLTALVGAVMCFGQRHIKRLLAFSTISHVGLLIIAFALLTPDGLAGAAVYTIGHGLAKASLFLVAGILLNRLGTMDVKKLHGKACDLKWTAVVFVGGGLALTGVPPFGTFLGAHMIGDAAAKHGFRWVEAVLFMTGALTCAAVLRSAGHVFWGLGPIDEKATEGSKDIKEDRGTEGDGERPNVRAAMWLPAAALLAISMVVTWVPQFAEHVKVASFTMADRSGFEARTLGSAHLPDLAPKLAPSPKGKSLMWSFATLAAALLLTWWSLSPSWPKQKKAPYALPLRGPLYFLRAIHTGHIGDYVAFLTFGVVATGAALGLLIHYLR